MVNNFDGDAAGFGFVEGAGGVAVECGTDVFSHTKATYRGSTKSPTAQPSHGDTKTRRKVLGRNADVLVGISTPEQDKYGNSETRLKNASIRGTAFSDVFDKHTNCGSKRTSEFAEKHRKPWIQLAQRSSCYESTALILQQFITDNGVKNLHVAGTRGSKEPDVWKFAANNLEEALLRDRAHPCRLGVPKSPQKNI